MIKNLSIIIPSYYEADNLKELIPAIHLSCKDKLSDYEIIVVDAINSMDETKIICEQFNVKYVIRMPTNCYGDAIRTSVSLSLTQLDIGHPTPK